MDVREAISRVCGLARERLTPERVRLARQRQAAAFAWGKTDYLPLVFAVEAPQLQCLPKYDWREQWFDPAKSFVEQMKSVVSYAAAGVDCVPGVRADTGVVNGPSLFGAEFDVPTHTKPIVKEYVPKDKLALFELPDDIRGLGNADRIFEHMQHHRGVLQEHGLADMVSVYHCDTQGPFDIAEQTRGHELFTDIYEDPEFVHHLMRQATRAYIALTLLCKRCSGEGECRGNASGYWMEEGGVRLCDDSGILLSPKLFEEFVLPYHKAALEHFKGGWIHYCGGMPGAGRAEGLHLHPLYLQIPRLRAFNFTTAHDWADEIRKVIAREVTYLGTLPRGNAETLEEYFRRVLSLCPGRKGLLFCTSVKGTEEAESALGLWHRLQDETFPVN